MDLPTRQLRELSLFSGMGAFTLALRLAGLNTRTVCYVEHDKYAQQVLQQRFGDGLDPAPIWDDINTFDPEPWRGHVDIVSAGFPCQPHSKAGSRRLAKGLDDARNLWPDFARLIREFGFPTWVFMENVSGPLFLRYYFFDIRKELREMGYTVSEGLFSAAETGAPQKRQRIFILAYRG